MSSPAQQQTQQQQPTWVPQLNQTLGNLCTQLDRSEDQHIFSKDVLETHPELVSTYMKICPRRTDLDTMKRLCTRGFYTKLKSSASAAQNNEIQSQKDKDGSGSAASVPPSSIYVASPDDAIDRFQQDCELIASNCIKFNGPDHFFSKIAESFLDFAKQKLAKVRRTFQAQHSAPKRSRDDAGSSNSSSSVAGGGVEPLPSGRKPAGNKSNATTNGSGAGSPVLSAGGGTAVSPAATAEFKKEIDRLNGLLKEKDACIRGMQDVETKRMEAAEAHHQKKQQEQQNGRQQLTQQLLLQYDFMPISADDTTSIDGTNSAANSVKQEGAVEQNTAAGGSNELKLCPASQLSTAGDHRQQYPFDVALAIPTCIRRFIVCEYLHLGISVRHSSSSLKLNVLDDATTEQAGHSDEQGIEEEEEALSTTRFVFPPPRSTTAMTSSSTISTTSASSSIPTATMTVAQVIDRFLSSKREVQHKEAQQTQESKHNMDTDFVQQACRLLRGAVDQLAFDTLMYPSERHAVLQAVARGDVSIVSSAEQSNNNSNSHGNSGAAAAAEGGNTAAAANAAATVVLVHRDDALPEGQNEQEQQHQQQHQQQQSYFSWSQLLSPVFLVRCALHLPSILARCLSTQLGAAVRDGALVVIGGDGEDVKHEDRNTSAATTTATTTTIHRTAAEQISYTVVPVIEALLQFISEEGLLNNAVAPK